MKRGEIWTVAGGKDYASKPRPVVIIQDERFDKTDSVTVCAFTTDPTDAPLLRIAIEPSEDNGLRAACRLMVDKITTVPRTKVRMRIGRLADEDMVPPEPRHYRVPGDRCSSEQIATETLSRHSVARSNPNPTQKRSLSGSETLSWF